MIRLHRALFRSSRSRNQASASQPVTHEQRSLRTVAAPHDSANAVTYVDVSKALAELEAAITALEGPVAARKALAAG
jgi:hypothetical protein